MSNQEQIEKNLKEKFDNFELDYKPNEKMWANIIEELPQKEKSSRKFLFLMPIFLVGSSFIIYLSISNNSEVISEDIEKINDFITLENEEQDEYRITENGQDFNPSKVSEGQKDQNELNQKSLQEFDAESFIEDSTETNDQNSTVDKTKLFSESTIPLQSIIQNENRTNIQTMLSIVSISSISSQIEMQGTEVLSSKLPNELELSPVEISEIDQRLSMGVWTGYNSLRAQYSLNDNAYSDVLEERKSSERPLRQYSLGLELEYDLNERWSLQSGLNYSFFQDESFFESETSRFDTIPNYEMVAQTSGGKDTTVVGTAFKTHITSSKTWSYTNRQLFSIPLLINYNIPIGNKSKFGFALGFEKIFYSKISGYELDKNGENYNLTKDEQNRYGTKGANALLRLNYNFNLTKSWDLRLMANYKYALSSNYNSSAPIKKSFNTFGVSIGSHIKF